jgi:pimeloyl-ACP methyl ester carboxylesterase
VAHRERSCPDRGLSRLPSPAPEPLTCERVAAIGTPTLVVGAEYGMPYSRLIVDRLVDCIPDSRLLIIGGVTHFMRHQEPDRFNDAVLAFLTEH